MKLGDKESKKTKKICNLTDGVTTLNRLETIKEFMVTLLVNGGDIEMAYELAVVCWEVLCEHEGERNLK